MQLANLDNLCFEDKILRIVEMFKNKELLILDIQLKGLPFGGVQIKQVMTPGGLDFALYQRLGEQTGSGIYFHSTGEDVFTMMLLTQAAKLCSYDPDRLEYFIPKEQ